MTGNIAPADEFGDLLATALNGPPPAPEPETPAPRAPRPNLAQGSGGGNPIPDPHADRRAFSERLREIVSRDATGNGRWSPLDPHSHH